MESLDMQDKSVYQKSMIVSCESLKSSVQAGISSEDEIPADF